MYRLWGNAVGLQGDQEHTRGDAAARRTLRGQLAVLVGALLFLNLVDITITMLAVMQGAAVEINPIVGQVDIHDLWYKLGLPALLFLTLVRPKAWYAQAVEILVGVFLILIVYECIGVWVMM